MKCSSVSLFSGALGLDLGLEKAGFVTRAMVECDKTAVQTIKNNLRHLNDKTPVVIEERLTAKNVPRICREILKETKMKPGKLDLLAGAPPCQPFSTAGRRKSFDDDRGTGFDIFLKVAAILKPRFFVLENVRGILSAAIKHRPLAERGPGFPHLLPEEEHGSAFKLLLRRLQHFARYRGYCITWGVLNAADFGCAQSRERLIIIGSRSGHGVWPTVSHSEQKIDGLPRWNTLKSALDGLRETSPDYLIFNPKVLDLIKKIPTGKNWRHLDPTLQEDALGSAFHSWGGRSGFLRRLAWSKVCPTITARPNAKATMLCHPEAHRPLSVRECARIQQFPDHWEFYGDLENQYSQIGNATPLALGESIGTAIVQFGRRRGVGTMKHMVLCADQSLRRMEQRPKTVLNPMRMRLDKSETANREWINGSGGKRTGYMKFLSLPIQVASNRSAQKHLLTEAPRA